MDHADAIYKLLPEKLDQYQYYGPCMIPTYILTGTNVGKKSIDKDLVILYSSLFFT